MPPTDNNARIDEVENVQQKVIAWLFDMEQMPFPGQDMQRLLTRHGDTAVVNDLTGLLAMTAKRAGEVEGKTAAEIVTDCHGVFTRSRTWDLPFSARAWDRAREATMVRLGGAENWGEGEVEVLDVAVGLAVMRFFATLKLPDEES